MYTLKLKRMHPDAILPTQGHPGEDVGWDMYAINDGDIKFDDFDAYKIIYIEYNTGWAIQPPDGFHVELFPRSSNSNKDLLLSNSVGVVDPGYRNNLMFRYKLIDNHDAISDAMGFTGNILNLHNYFSLYKKGDRCGQMVLRQTFNFDIEEIGELEVSCRGTNGFGSTGN